MSELKAHKAYNRWIDEEMPTPNDDLICNEVYLKYEADKVIEELKESVKGLILDNYLKDKETRHNKYKRCLAMAKWCDAKADWYYSIGESFRNRVEFYMKWHKRWLELAEKFKDKEAK